MAEIAIGAAVKVMLENLVTIVGREFNLIAGFESELESLKETLETTREFLDDAEGKEVKENAVKGWLKKLQNVAYEADDLVDEVNYDIIRRKVMIRDQMKRKICMFFACCKPLAFRSEMARKINELKLKFESINEKAKELGLTQILVQSAVCVPAVFETISMSSDPVVGRENEASEIINMMMVDSINDGISVLPIVGQGGLGKTTLAQLIFNDERIKEKFKEKIWLCVAADFNTTEILKRIYTSLTKASCPVESMADIVVMIREKLSSKRYLLILDDLWNKERNHWEDLRKCLVNISASKGNFVLVTTRNHDVASIVSPLADRPLIGTLSDDDCWSIMKKRAFSGEEVSQELETIGKKIASKCKGLPLAANMAGATLQGKTDADDWNSILKNGFSAPNTGEDSVLQVLKVSYDRLPSSLLKKCFAYCSIFQKDEKLERERLVQLWIAEGFLVESTLESDMEMLGKRVFDTLLRGCFFQESDEQNYDDKTYYKMHDLVMFCVGRREF